MKYLSVFLVIFCLWSCNDKGAEESSAYKYISADTINILQPGDSALIHISYPQGTAWYQYECAGTTGAVSITGHTTNEGDPDNAGGAMGETFFLKAVKSGPDTINLIDKSPAAMKAASDTVRPINNKKIYIVEVR